MPVHRLSQLPALLWILLGLLCCPLPGSAQNDAPPPAELAGAIYLDPWEIEKEFLISPLLLQSFLDLGITADSQLTPEQRQSMKPKIGEFLASKCPVSIQEEPLEFTLDRIHFIEPNDQEFVLIDPEATVPAKDIRISIVYAAPNPDLRQALEIMWNLMPPKAPYVTVKVADAAGTRLFNLSKFAPSINVRGRYQEGSREAPKPPPPTPETEEESTRIPWLSIVLLLALLPVVVRLLRAERPSPVAVFMLVLLAVAAALVRKSVTIEISQGPKGTELTEAQSSEILDPLLRGVYHAFHYREQSQQYDVLDKVVGGDALTPIFLEVQRTLESRERDGSRVRVNDLKIEDSTPTPLADRPGFEAMCNWEVSGRVGHWGHFHDRTNLYRATFVIEPLKDTWKITSLTLHARERESVISNQ